MWTKNKENVGLEITTHPLSLKDFNWEFVSLLGSPFVSEATASNSSKGGSVKRSFRFICLFLRLLTLFCVFDDVTTVVKEIGWGRAVKKVFNKLKKRLF